MTQSTLSAAPLSEVAHFRATFPVGLWATALVVACLLTGFVGSALEEDSAWAQKQTAPAAEAPAGQAG
jgi:hypothetical protein